MMHARTRRYMIDRMMQEYNEELVYSLVDTIASEMDTSPIKAAEIVLDAWQRSKPQPVEAIDTFVNITHVHKCRDAHLLRN